MADKQLPDHRTTVRVTMFPDPIEVDKDEIPHLRSQGILVEDEPDVTAGKSSRRGVEPSAGDKPGDKPGTSE